MDNTGESKLPPPTIDELDKEKTGIISVDNEKIPLLMKELDKHKGKTIIISAGNDQIPAHILAEAMKRDAMLVEGNIRPRMKEIEPAPLPVLRTVPDQPLITNRFQSKHRNVKYYRFGSIKKNRKAQRASRRKNRK